jgi:hypothetical protein
VFPGTIVVRARVFPVIGRVHRFRFLSYQYPSVVVESLRPFTFANTGLLVEIHGRLGKVVVARHRRLRNELAKAGFHVIDVVRWDRWLLGEPDEVAPGALDAHVGEVPPSVVARERRGSSGA